MTAPLPSDTSFGISGISPWNLRLRWLFAVTIFTVLPYLLISFYLGRAWDQEKDEAIERIALRLEITMMRLLRRTEQTNFYFGGLLWRSWTKVCRLPHRQRPQAAREMFQKYHRRFPGVFRFFPMDRDHQPLIAWPEDHRPVEDWKSLALIIEQSRIDRRFRGTLFPRHLDLIKRFYGNSVNPWDIPFNDSYVTKQAVPGAPFGNFFASFHPGNYLFAFMNEIPGYVHLGLRTELAARRSFFARKGVTVGHVPGSDPIIRDRTLRDAVNALGHSNALSDRFGDELVTVARPNDQGLVWFRYSLRRVIDRVERKRGFLVCGALLIGLWSLVLFTLMSRPSVFSASLRLRLIGLFLFACGFPLLAVWLAGRDYLHEKRLVLRTQVWEDLSERLLHFDRGLRDENSLLARQMVRQARDFGTLDRSGLHERLSSLAKEHPKAAFFVNRSDGTLITAWGAALINSSEQLLLGTLGKKMMAELNRSSIQGFDTAGLVLDSVGKELEVVGNFLRSIDRFMDWDLGGNRNFILFHPIRTPDGHQFHRFFFVHMKDFDRFRSYVEQRLHQHSRHLPRTVFSVHHPQFGGFLPGPLFPPWSRYAQPQHRLKDLVKFRGRSAHARLVGKTELLLCGVRSPTFPHVTYVALHRGTVINSQIRALEADLGRLLLLSLVFSLLLGFHLSERFLAPLSHLKAGVNAIRHQEFRYRVPVENPDEFGHLSESFNQAMENLADLDLGRILQERLFPDGMYQTGRYRIAGKSQFASQLGGDIFDIRPLPNGKTLILIGDVTGHGLGAALVMAMARGLFCKLASEALSPDQMLRAIHAVLFRTMKRRRMMTCCICLLDPEAHHLEIANAGHCAPILIQRDRPAKLLTTASKPLGSWKSIEPAILTFDLEPGDRLFLYTDGAVEATIADGSQIGYDRLGRQIETYQSEAPSDQLGRLFAWLREVSGAALQADDVTCILVSRDRETGQEATSR